MVYKSITLDHALVLFLISSFNSVYVVISVGSIFISFPANAKLLEAQLGQAMTSKASFADATLANAKLFKAKSATTTISTANFAKATFANTTF